jgi:hypothetical protein
MSYRIANPPHPPLQSLDSHGFTHRKKSHEQKKPWILARALDSNSFLSSKRMENQPLCSEKKALWAPCASGLDRWEAEAPGHWGQDISEVKGFVYFIVFIFAFFFLQKFPVKKLIYLKHIIIQILFFYSLFLSWNVNAYLPTLQIIKCFLLGFYNDYVYTFNNTYL